MPPSYPLVRNQTKESIAKFFLSFGHVFKVFLIIVICITYGNRKLIGKATILLFFSMIYNTLLKQIFKVPLYPHLGEGYAFPSGHMHAFGLFYGYFFIHSKNPVFKVFTSIIIVGISISLVYMRYHHAFDVFGAVVFFVVELFIDDYIVHNYGEKIDLLVILSICVISTFGLFLEMHEIQFHIWLALYGMVGIILAFFVIKNSGYQNFLQKSLSLAITLTLNKFLTDFWKRCDFKRSYVSQLIYLFVPLIIIGALKVCQRVSLPRTFFDDWPIFRN